MDTLAAMRAFAQVVVAGSFAAAARQMGVATSSVSRPVGELEYQLGARLFYRTTRKLSLTEAGHIYYDRVAGILTAVDEATLAVAQNDGMPSGILRLTVPTGIGRYIVASILPNFLTNYPNIRRVLSMTDQMIDIVEAGVDLAIRVGPQRDSSLIARRVGASRRVICGSPAYLNSAGTPLTPSDLERHNCLTFRAHPGSNAWKFNGPDKTIEVRVTGAGRGRWKLFRRGRYSPGIASTSPRSNAVSFFATNADALTAAAVAGLGLILLPDWNMGNELAEGKLIEVLSDWRAVPEASPIFAVYPPQGQLAPKVRAFIDFLVDQVGSLSSDTLQS